MGGVVQSHRRYGAHRQPAGGGDGKMPETSGT